VIKHISTGDGSSSLFVEELNENYRKLADADENILIIDFCCN